MIKKTVEKALNEQVTREIYSSMLYLSMAGYFTAKNLTGFANWMRIQAKEEMDHGMKMFDFVLDRGGETKINTIDAPPADWDSPLAVIEATYIHEQAVTAHINDLAELAISEKDYATNNLMQWFVDEQVEEEASVDEIVNKMKMMEGFPGGLIMMDAELKQRVYVPPATTKE
ncbi:ferritin [Bacteroidota bacterium]